MSRSGRIATIICWVSILLILGVGFPIFPSISNASTSITYQVDTIWNETEVKTLTISNEYLYLQKNDSTIILVQNGSKIAEYTFFQTVYGIAAVNDTLFISGYTGEATVFAVSFSNFSNPLIISNISHWTTGGSPSIISYNQYVYAACQEWGFPIFDFSNHTHPTKAGSVSVPTWHSRRIYRVYNYGVFYGDHCSRIFDLRSSPTSPRLLWDFKGDPGRNSGHILGIPAVSSQFFVLNFRYFVVGEESKKMFNIIPRENATHIAQPFNITYSAENTYEHTALLHENILLVSDANNTLNVFEINEKKINFLLEIDLGVNGSIEQLYSVEDSNELLIADSANGLLKVSLEVTRTPPKTNLIPGFLFSTILLISIPLLKFHRVFHVKPTNQKRKMN